MTVLPGQGVTFDFNVYNPSSGALANADSTPTGTLVVNGVDNAATVTITNLATGRYKAAVTLPSTLTGGQVIEVRISATVSSTAQEDVLWRATVDPNVLHAGLAQSGSTSTLVKTNITPLTPDLAGCVISAGGIRRVVLSSSASGGVNAEFTVTRPFPGLGPATNDQVIIFNADLPVALDGGGMFVGQMGANTLNASALAADAVSEIQAGLATSASQTTIINAVNAVDDYVDSEVAAIKAVTDRLETNLTNTRIGKLDNLDAAVSSRLATAGYTAPDNASITTILSRVDVAVSTRLAPAVAGRAIDLDVSGYVYLQPFQDYANAGSVTSVTDPVAVGSIGANAITAAAIAADAVAEIQAGLATAASITTLSGYVDTEVAAIKSVTDKLDSALELDGAVWRYTTNALERAPAGGGGGGGVGTVVIKAGEGVVLS